MNDIKHAHYGDTFRDGLWLVMFIKHTRDTDLGKMFLALVLESAFPVRNKIGQFSYGGWEQINAEA